MSKHDDKSRLISLADAAAIYGFDQRYLAKLAQKSRLKAEKLGNMWVTTMGSFKKMNARARNALAFFVWVGACCMSRWAGCFLIGR